MEKIKYYCDRCNKEIHYPITKPFGLFKKRISIRTYRDQEIDLCQECCDSLERWMRNQICYDHISRQQLTETFIGKTPNAKEYDEYSIEHNESRWTLPGVLSEIRCAPPIGMTREEYRKLKRAEYEQKRNNSVTN